MNILLPIFILLGIAGAVTLIVFSVMWSVHIEMNKENGMPYDWCTFKRFKKEFDKYRNHPQLEKGAFGGESIFLYGANCSHIVYLHASIIEFNGKCMILYPHSYFWYCIWKWYFNKERKRTNKQKGLWI